MPTMQIINWVLLFLPILSQVYLLDENIIFNRKEKKKREKFSCVSSQTTNNNKKSSFHTNVVLLRCSFLFLKKKIMRTIKLEEAKQKDASLDTYC
jgi:hypothetical protein